MPMPKPKKGESKDEFISRCAADELMNKDYPDTNLRLGVCYQQWDDKDKKSNPPEIERRNIDLIELRVIDEEGKKPKIRGHAAVFNKLSEPMWGFREKIAPGTFKNSIEKDDIRALFNHDARYVLGRNKSQTLTLQEDDKGLYIEIDADEQISYVSDLMRSIRRGDISQMSFGFITIKDAWEHIKGQDSIRTLEEVKLFDISPVTYPAYPQTSVKVRDYMSSIQQAEEEPDEKGSQPKAGAELSLAKQRLNYGYPLEPK